MNPRDIHTKIDLVSDNVARLRLLPTETFEGFTSDFRNADSALHRLQTSIQALIDIASYVVSSLGLRTPANSVDLIEVLREEGLIPDERAEVYTNMVHFRNRVVHLYNRIDTRRVYQIVCDELGDTAEFLGRLIDIIEANPG